MEYLPDYYAVLEILPTASQSDIERAFRALARRYHPDLNHAPDAHERMALINQAYQVLRDAKQRAQYDQERAVWRELGRIAPLKASKKTTLNNRVFATFYEQQILWRENVQSYIEVVLERVMYAYEAYGYEILKTERVEEHVADLIIRRRTVALTRVDIGVLISSERVRLWLKRLSRLPKGATGAYITTGFFDKGACTLRSTRKFVCYDGLSFAEVYRKALQKRSRHL